MHGTFFSLPLPLSEVLRCQQSCVDEKYHSSRLLCTLFLPSHKNSIFWPNNLCQKIYPFIFGVETSTEHAKMDFSNVESPKMTYASALPFQLAPPLNSSIQTSVPKGAREVFTEERWKGMKPIIRQLYTIERKPYGRVIEILRTEHDFFPTYDVFPPCPSCRKYTY